MMRQHSKVVHASSEHSDNYRAAKVQERMASSISVEWNTKRAPQTAMVWDPLPIERLIKQRNVPAQSRKPSREVAKSNIPAPPSKANHSKVNSKEIESASQIAARKTSGEYGRLFIKVVKLKDLELPLPCGIFISPHTTI